jgi:hypothetical protein
MKEGADMTSTISSRKLATVLATAALGATAAPAYAVPEYGSPDARDNAIAKQVSSSSELQSSFGSPDARDAATGYAPRLSESAVSSSFASPDARDAATGYAPPVPVNVSTDSSPSSGGVDWLTVALGVAGIGGLILLLVGLLTHRRHTPGAHPA